MSFGRTLAILAGIAACGGTPAPRPAHAVRHDSPFGEEAPPTVAEAAAQGQEWRLDTPHGPVHVWVPRHYAAKTARTIVYVHGYYTDVDGAWTSHRLPEQFARSGLNAMFIACEAPSQYPDPVRWASLSELLQAVEDGIGEPVPRDRVVAVGHSAAFRTLTAWLADPELDTLVLFDAAYEVDQFVAWAKSDAHRLIDVGDDTRAWTEQLHRALPDTVIIDHMPSADEALPVDARVLYIQSAVGHMELVEDGQALPIVLRAITDERVRGAPVWSSPSPASGDGS
jgi:hypothetical protein